MDLFPRDVLDEISGAELSQFLRIYLPIYETNEDPQHGIHSETTCVLFIGRLRKSGGQKIGLISLLLNKFS